MGQGDDTHSEKRGARHCGIGFLATLRGPFDWDAVSRQFWKVSVTLLPVEENSLDFGIDKIYPERTHVHFRKSR